MVRLGHAGLPRLGIALRGGGLLFIDPVSTSSLWPLFLLGGIATFQAGLFLVWRMLVRPIVAAGGHVGSQRRFAARRAGPFRAVFLPAAAVLALLVAAVGRCALTRSTTTPWSAAWSARP